MIRIEDLCHTHVSHKWLNHLDACAGSVLMPYDYITNVQKRFSNRAYTAFGQSRLCGSFFDSQLEHGETCTTAEDIWGHYECVHAVFGGQDSRTQVSPRNNADRQIFSLPLLSRTQRGSGRVCGILQCSSSPRDAAQAAFDRKISHCRHQFLYLQRQGIVYRLLVWTADGHPHPAVTRTLQYAADITAWSTNVRKISFSIDCITKSILPFQHEPNGFSPAS